MIHIPTRTPLAWYHYSWEAPLWKPLNVRRNPPPPPTSKRVTLTELIPAGARQLKISCQHVSLSRMTCVFRESWDGRLLWVRGRNMWLQRGGWVQKEGRFWKSAAAMTRKIPFLGERKHESHLSWVAQENTCFLCVVNETVVFLA